MQRIFLEFFSTSWPGHDHHRLMTSNLAVLPSTMDCIIQEKQRTRNAAGRTFTHSKPVVVYVYHFYYNKQQTKLFIYPYNQLNIFAVNFLFGFIVIMGWFLFDFGKTTENTRNVHYCNLYHINYLKYEIIFYGLSLSKRRFKFF